MAVSRALAILRVKDWIISFGSLCSKVFALHKTPDLSLEGEMLGYPLIHYPGSLGQILV